MRAAMSTNWYRMQMQTCVHACILSSRSYVPKHRREKISFRLTIRLGHCSVGPHRDSPGRSHRIAITRSGTTTLLRSLVYRLRRVDTGRQSAVCNVLHQTLSTGNQAAFRVYFFREPLISHPAVQRHRAIVHRPVSLNVLFSRSIKFLF